MSRKRLIAGLTGVVAVTALVTTGALSAQAGVAADGNDLAGTWRITVNRPAPLPPLTSLQVYTGEGSTIETANESQATRTPAFGSWERVNGHTYAATSVFFRFDPVTGAHTVTQKITRRIELSLDGQTFTNTGRATIYNAAGQEITSFPVSGAGERVRVERLEG
jgi:hypothetical protein